MTSATVLETGRRRRVATWAAIAVGVVAVAVAGTLISGMAQWSQRAALDPDSFGPTGTHALTQLLRDQGVDVLVTRDRVDAARLLSERSATLALPDPPALSDDAVQDLVDAAADVVLLDPRSRTLDVVQPGSVLAGAGGDLVEPACDLAEADRSGAVSPGTLFEPAASSDAGACYRDGDGYGLIVETIGEQRRVAIDALALFTNEHLASDGNAALALNLLGRHDAVVWYVPNIGDSDLAGTATLGSLTPPWVSPVIVLLLTTGLVAAIWRGRRFGPLVAERLPVTVRASETTEGRARLYARSRDAVHAADQLRIGALRRIARDLALGPAAGADEIADAAAERTGWDRTRVRGILLHDLPRTDAQLVTVYDELRTLEAAVRAAVRPTNRGSE